VFQLIKSNRSGIGLDNYVIKQLDTYLDPWDPLSAVWGRAAAHIETGI